MVDEKLIEAFHLTWDHYPETVILIYKDRTIIAINKAGEKAGRQIGIKCYSTTADEIHTGCKANDALRNHVYTYVVEKREGGAMISFWLPIDGYNDYLIHFSVRTTKYE
jgi:hypothetical protein